MLTVPSEPLSVTSDILGYFFGMPITNTMTTGLLDAILIIILAISVARFRLNNPGKFQMAVEMILDGLQNFIANIAGSYKIAKKIMPVVVSIIVFILISNLVTLFLPVLSGFTYNGLAMFRTHTNDFNTTLALSTTVVLLTQIYSIFKINIFNYIFRFIQIKQVILAFTTKGGKGPVVLIDVFLGFLDIVSEFSKIFSLSLRLFGNVFAGELLVGVLMTILAVFLPLPIMILSLLSGVIQAVVFGALSTSFFASVLADEEE